MAQLDKDSLGTTEATHTAHKATDPASANTRITEARPFTLSREHPGTNWRVVLPTFVIVIAVVLWGTLGTSTLATAADRGFSWTTGSFGWLFVLVMTAGVGFILYLAMSKYGSIRIGKDTEKPEFKTHSWIAMMFAAGMGIGLMFFGVTEPLSHFHTPPPGSEGSNEGEAMAVTAFHWTLHPWATYAIVGLALGLTAYRFGRSNLISQALVPLIGERNARGILGTIIDVLTIIATIFGTAASLGIGAIQIRTGLIETGTIDGGGIGVVVGVILVLGVGFLISALSGVSKGIQLLSNINLILALVLAVFVAVASGALLHILNLVPTTLGQFLQNFLQMASRTGASENGEAAEWVNSWTVFYWAWWISWSPFVGMFLARISRGRTIRQFVSGVVIVPSVLSVLWFSIFGGTARFLEMAGAAIANTREDIGSEVELFNLFREIPGTPLLMFIAMLLISVFFITSADSASVVMGGMGQYGVDNPHRWLTALFGICTGGIAIIMLLAGGGTKDALQSLQSLTIIAASPFVIILVLLAVSIMRMLREDPTGKVLIAMRSPREWEKISGFSSKRQQIREIAIGLPADLKPTKAKGDPAAADK